VEHYLEQKSKAKSAKRAAAGSNAGGRDDGLDGQHDGVHATVPMGAGVLGAIYGRVFGRKRIGDEETGNEKAESARQNLGREDMLVGDRRLIEEMVRRQIEEEFGKPGPFRSRLESVVENLTPPLRSGPDARDSGQRL
jgi:hypothetical protein